MTTQPEPYASNGPCPFLTCTQAGPHSHEVCGTCGAVKHGNITCPECVSVWNELRAAEGLELWPMPAPEQFGWPL